MSDDTATGWSETLPASPGSAIPTDREALSRGTEVGRYIILSRLGEGGMGVVHSAYDPLLDRKVAIKVLRANKNEQHSDTPRLLREAQALAKLSHPNVVAIHDVGFSNGHVWLAMELIHGKTMRLWLQDRRRHWRDVLKVMLEAGQGLIAAHNSGLLHRDFKPDNIMVGDDGRVWVMDLGLARSFEGPSPVTTSPDADTVHAAEVDALSMRLTHSGSILGTPAYMAPEQLQGRPADARTDVFSFCVTLWEALFGQRPFAGDTFAELAANVLTGTTRGTPTKTTVPRWLKLACLRGLRSDPKDRWQSADSMVRALSRRSQVRTFVSIGIIMSITIALAARFTIESHNRNLRAQAALYEAAPLRADASRLRRELTEARNSSFQAYDDGNVEGGEYYWAAHLETRGRLRQNRASTLRLIEDALQISPEDPDLRRAMAEALEDLLLLAHQESDGTASMELFSRIALYDDGSTAERMNTPGTLHISSSPEGAQITIEKYLKGENGNLELAEPRTLGSTPISGVKIGQGSYLLTLDRGAIRFPILVESGASLDISINARAARMAPAGYVYVEKGQFIVGSPDPEDLRKYFFMAPPAHTTSIHSYIIGRNEVTFSDWIRFVQSIPQEQRERMLPATDQLSLSLSEQGDIELQLKEGESSQRFRVGETILREGATGPSSQNWLLMPVVGISAEQALEYTAWLSERGFLPGARLCDEWEWERAARGADIRRFPHGESVSDGDANISIASSGWRGGLEEVGQRVRDESPFGVRDMLGNAAEWTSSHFKSDEFVTKGSSFFFDSMMGRVYNRAPLPATFREHSIGMRICASIMPANTGSNQ